MDKKSRSSSNISLDSLEVQSKRKLPIKVKASDENVDTILVPFYEKDVLMKIPKTGKKQRQNDQIAKKDVYKGETQQYKSYLMNKNLQKCKRTSYLEIFRKQFSSNFTEKVKKDPNEIRSISPEFGDTERESIGEECNNNIVNEFYNTESYNEIYYEKLMSQELEQYLNQSFEESLRFNDDVRNKSPDDMIVNDLRSISEVSRPRRHIRRTTVPINNNVRLGGLGPDMDNIRPRLERAKSLQRYSEKVRMENRLKFYKKGIEAENEKKADKGISAKRRGSSDNKYKDQRDNKKSYLVNKTQDKSSVMKKNCHAQSKSADVKKSKGKNIKDVDNIIVDNEQLKEKELKGNGIIERKLFSAKGNLEKYLKGNYVSTKVKSSARSQDVKADEKNNNAVSPVEITFMVNVGGIRPSTALKSLEEKHRLYQEKVKEFTMDPNNV